MQGSFRFKKGTILNTEAAIQIWAASLGQLQLEIPRPNFETWLKETTAFSLQDDCLTVVTPSAFAAEMLERRLYSTIARAVERVSQRKLKVIFKVSGTPAVGGANARGAVPPPVPGESSAYERTIPSPAGLRPGFNFDSFIVGPSNRLAHAAATKVSESPGNVYNPLYVYSNVGLGKTHLLHAIGHRLVEKGLEVIYVSSERFTNEYIKAIREGTTEQFRQRYRTADALLIDDIQFIASKEQTQEGFFHTFNELHMSGKQIVVTGDEPARTTLLEERIQSRLSGGLVVDIQAPDYETRYAILQSKAPQAIPSAVVDLLARRSHDNVRELEGALNRIVAYSQLVDSPITPELAQQALRSLLAEASIWPADPETVIAAVADQTGIDASEIKGRRRDKRTAHARQMAMYLLREESALPSTRVGLLLGGKDHSTVLYAQKRFEEQLEGGDAALRSEVASVRQRIASLRNAARHATDAAIAHSPSGARYRP